MRGFAPPATGQADNAQPQPAAEQRLQNIAAGQQQARSLGAARGSGPAPLTAQRLLEMSEKDFAKILETVVPDYLVGFGH